MADGETKSLTEQQERFCRYIVEGMNQTDAYKAAGYKGAYKSMKDNAARLIANDSVTARIAQLRSGAAKRTELNAAHFAKRLERLALAAEMAAFGPIAQGGDALAVTPKEAADIARQCTMDAAKLLGQVIDQTRVQSENINYSIGDQPMTEDDWEREFGETDALGPAGGPATRAH